MKGTKELKTNKGITLIALVITIIVMLILVAVTISMAVNGGLFEYASNAGAKTNGAIANEQNLANLEAGMTVDQLIDKYTESSNGCEKCKDGYVTGYVCPNFGTGCKVVNKSFAGGYWVYCNHCLTDIGFSLNGFTICPSCEYEFRFDGNEREDHAGGWVQFSECLHCTYLPEPKEGKYPCPDCSIINFSIGDRVYFAQKGYTWSDFIKDNNSFEMSKEGYVLINLATSAAICTSDWEMVMASSPILERS